MKYLKLFENHQLYNEISEYEFDDDMEGRPSIPFTKDEYQIICDIFKNWKHGSKDQKVVFAYSAIVPNSIIEVGNMDETWFAIWKCSDSWFYFEDDDISWTPPYVRRYYKCDEFEGLVNCIKNVLN